MPLDQPFKATLTADSSLQSKQQQLQNAALIER